MFTVRPNNGEKEQAANSTNILLMKENQADALIAELKKGTNE